MIGKQFFFSQILKQVSFNQNEAFLERPTFTFLLPNQSSFITLGCCLKKVETLNQLTFNLVLVNKFPQEVVLSFFLDFCPERLIRIISKFHSYVLYCIASCFFSNCFSIYRISNGKFHTSLHTKKPTEGIDAKTRKLLTN